jgi:hypothetical protein
MSNRLYELKLGEETTLSGWAFMRIPGGWLVYAPGNSQLSPLFVPYDNEFYDRSIELSPLRQDPRPDLDDSLTLDQVV